MRDNQRFQERGEHHQPDLDVLIELIWDLLEKDIDDWEKLICWEYSLLWKWDIYVRLILGALNILNLDTISILTLDTLNCVCHRSSKESAKFLLFN